MDQGWTRRIAITLGVCFVGAIVWTTLTPAPQIVITADPLELFDKQVETEFASTYVLSDVAAFFQQGGVYCDHEDFAPFDRPYVVPILTRLAERFDLSWQVASLPEDPGYAISIYAPIPEGVTKQALRDALVEEQNRDGFPGDILQQWGHRYLSLDFDTPEQLAAYEEEEVVWPEG